MPYQQAPTHLLSAVLDLIHSWRVTVWDEKKNQAWISFHHGACVAALFEGAVGQDRVLPAATRRALVKPASCSLMSCAGGTQVGKCFRGPRSVSSQGHLCKAILMDVS